MTMICFRLSEPFQAELRRRGDTIVVVASGEIDLAYADELEAGLRAALNRSLRVVLDLRDVEFLDCAGLRRILDFQQLVREAGGEFALIPGPSQVQRLFDVTRVSGALCFIDRC